MTFDGDTQTTQQGDLGQTQAPTEPTPAPAEPAPTEPAPAPTEGQSM